jgi:hypothetical protein
MGWLYAAIGWLYAAIGWLYAAIRAIEAPAEAGPLQQLAQHR